MSKPRSGAPATRNSLRAFYTMLREAKRTFDFESSKNHTAAWAALQPALCKMEMLAEYQHKRKVVNDEAVKFLNDNLREARKNYKEFYGFVEHFQSVIAYLREK